MDWCCQNHYWLNSSPPGQNGRHFADDIFKCTFVNEKFCILIWISLKFVPKDPIDNTPALVQVMAWCRAGDEPLSEPLLSSSVKHICDTRGRWDNITNKVQWHSPLSSLTENVQFIKMHKLKIVHLQCISLKLNLYISIQILFIVKSSFTW